MTERRLRQEISYDAIVDRRRPIAAQEPQRLEWADPAMPGTIRPGVTDEWDGVERRRVPGAGDE